MIIFLTANRVFTDVRRNFKLSGLLPVMSSQDKRSYNTGLLSEEIEKASVRLS